MWNVRVSIFLVVSTLRQFLHHRSGETLKTSDRGRQLRSKCLCALLSFVFLFFFFLLKCRLSVNSVRQHVILTWQEGFSQYGNKTFVWLVFFLTRRRGNCEEMIQTEKKKLGNKSSLLCFFLKKDNTGRNQRLKQKQHCDHTERIVSSLRWGLWRGEHTARLPSEDEVGLLPGDTWATSESSSCVSVSSQEVQGLRSPLTRTATPPDATTSSSTRSTTGRRQSTRSSDTGPISCIWTWGAIILIHSFIHLCFLVPQRLTETSTWQILHRKHL